MTQGVTRGVTRGVLQVVTRRKSASDRGASDRRVEYEPDNKPPMSATQFRASSAEPQIHQEAHMETPGRLSQTEEETAAEQLTLKAAKEAAEEAAAKATEEAEAKTAAKEAAAAEEAAAEEEAATARARQLTEHGVMHLDGSEFNQAPEVQPKKDAKREVYMEGVVLLARPKTATESAVVEEPVVELVIVEDAASAEEPAVEEGAAAEEPVVQDTAAEEPVVQDAAAEPAVKPEPAVKQAAAEEAAAKESASVDETAAQPLEESAEAEGSKRSTEVRLEVAAAENLAATKKPSGAIARAKENAKKRLAAKKCEQVINVPARTSSQLNATRITPLPVLFAAFFITSFRGPNSLLSCLLPPSDDGIDSLHSSSIEFHACCRCAQCSSSTSNDILPIS